VSISERTICDLKHQLSDCQQQLKDQKKKYWNERRRNYRLQKAHVARKLDLKRVKEQAHRLRGTLQTLGKDLEKIQGTAEGSVCLLQTRIKELEIVKKDLTQTRTVLRKRNKRIASRVKLLKERMKSKRQMSSLRMTQRGIYTQQTRALVRLMVSSGMAEAKVGGTLQEIGRSFGIKIEHKMSKRTVQRAILEGGVAAVLQLAYEMAQTDSRC
jgi:chromosome segregation ATPase